MGSWGSLLEDHVVVGVVEGVTTHHPHQPRVHQSLMGRPTQRLSWRFDTWQHPEGLGGGNGQRAVWTWDNQRNHTHWHTLLSFGAEVGILIFCRDEDVWQDWVILGCHIAKFKCDFVDLFLHVLHCKVHLLQPSYFWNTHTYTQPHEILSLLYSIILLSNKNNLDPEYRSDLRLIWSELDVLRIVLRGAFLCGVWVFSPCRCESKDLHVRMCVSEWVCALEQAMDSRRWMDF